MLLRHLTTPLTTPCHQPQQQRWSATKALCITLLLLTALIDLSAALIDESLSEHEGKTVVIPCPVNIEQCGKLHSINWFKGDGRIAAVLLDDSNQTSVIPEYKDRVIVGQNHPFTLVIKDLQISDEDIYYCDTTFFIPAETCDNVNGYRVELNVLVPPTEVVILDEKGDRIENGSIVGPMQERQTLKTSCVVRNTRPQPQVGWWRGNKRLTTHSPSYDEQDGLYTATLELSLELSRDDLGHTIECRVESAALTDVVKNYFSVDLQVRPTSISINGVEHHTVQGSKVVLTCDIHGARPPVNLTWYNSTEMIGAEENELTEIRTKAFEKADGTYHTQSELIFNATRFENDMRFRCDAENIVLQLNREKPLTASLTLEVLYPPVVKVSTTNATVNSGKTVLLNCEYVGNPASLTHVEWYRNGELVNVNDTERFDGGNSENVALVIHAASKDDIGNYSCQLSNVIGKGVSEEQIELDVLYVPTVEVLMMPEGPVKESDESNVTLYCNITDANPALLTKVRWYANSTLLKELPDCEETREDLCHIDPSKLLLESVGRGFFYNYSCEGYNTAGWGPRSEDKELVVYYEPGPANLTSYPIIATKKKSVKLTCAVDDPGYPESIRFRWLRGGRGPLQDIVTRDWLMEPVGLDSRTNYSCYAYNEGGKGAVAIINLEVHAPPFFIRNLPPYTGVLHSVQSANLTCRIECVPRCDIYWLKDGLPIDANDKRYFVKEKYMDASPATGDFESMLSVLHFNMSMWPNKKFDIETDNANYTCVSTGNTVGDAIRSSTYFSIEYAPYNVNVSTDVVYVEEDRVPKSVTCSSKSDPEPTYDWFFNNKSVTHGNTLIINTPMNRNDTGRYTCMVRNKHGSSSADAFIDVQFKPRCEIERRELDDQDTLICTAFGNPAEADFSWSIKTENETSEWLGNGDRRTMPDKSFYVLDEDYAIARTYRCVANNTVGEGTICEIEVAEQLAWWQRWDQTTLIILIASILGLLLAVIIICCIIICICRQRRRQDKYNTDVTINTTTQSVLSYVTAQSSISPQPQGPQMGVALPIRETSPTASYNLLPTLKSQLHDSQQQKAIVVSAARHSNNNNNNENNNINNNNNNNNSSSISISINSTSAAAVTHTSTPTNSTATAPPLPAPSSLPAPPREHNGTRTPASFISATKQAPKSPPRWPLRPGVMVHVSSDTKENLAVNRMTLRPQQHAGTLTRTTLFPATGTLTLRPANDSLLSNTSAGGGGTPQAALAQVSLQVATLGRLRQSQRLEAAAANSSLADGRLGGGASQTLPSRKRQLQTALQPMSSAQINPNDQILTAANEQQAEEAAMMPSLSLEASPDDVTDDAGEGATQRRANVSASSVCQLMLATTVDETGQAAMAATASRTRGRHRRLERVETFFASLFRRDAGGKREDGTRDSQRSHVGLLASSWLQGARSFWRRGDVLVHSSRNSGGPRNEAECDSSPFTAEHRLKGIRCSGSVTYKKTPVLTQRYGGDGFDKAPLTSLPPLHSTNSQTVTAVASADVLTAPTATHSDDGSHNNNNSPNQPSGSGHSSLPPDSQPASYASVTFQMPSSVKALLARSSLRRSQSKSTPNSEQRSVGGDGAGIGLGGILKSPTPPPRPPPPQRMAATSTQPHTPATSAAAALTSLSMVAGLPVTKPPPPLPPPLLLKRTINVKPTKIERVQIHDKSSSLGDPLTEPGEYENLPFHGLQTAPNKFSTTPTNFNNNTNVVRIAPRPKRLNGSISQTPHPTLQQQAQEIYDQHQPSHQTLHHQQQQQQQQQQQPPTHSQQQYNTMQYGRAAAAPPPRLLPAGGGAAGLAVGYSQTLLSGQHGGIGSSNSSNQNNNNKSLHSLHDAITMNGGSGASAAIPHSHQITYNLNNCFPKSYTEYYHHQQQQQKPTPPAAAAAAAQLLNAIEHEYPAYAIVERGNGAQAGNAATDVGVPAAPVLNTNPFLAATNFKRYDTADTAGTLNMAVGAMVTGSMQRSKRKPLLDKADDKKFYSLKFNDNKNGGSKALQHKQLPPPQHLLGVNLSMGSTTATTAAPSKCKRHHSFAGGSIGDIDPHGLFAQQQQVKLTLAVGSAGKTPLRFYDPPVYENLNDSAGQIYECALATEAPQSTATVLLHAQPSGSAAANPHGGTHAGQTGQKKKHHHRQHQQKDDFNLIEPERLSIYRSDSGISNSSYECVTPVLRSSNGAGTPPSSATNAKSTKTLKGSKTSGCSLANSTVAANFNSSHKKAPRMPINGGGTTPACSYVEGQADQQQLRSCSPASTLVNSSYESASSSQNDGTGGGGACSTDPTSLSSSNSLHSSGTGIAVGSLANKATLLAAARCNHRQQQRPPDVGTPEEYEQYQLGHHTHSTSSLSVASSVSAGGGGGGGGGKKCKKQLPAPRTPMLNGTEPTANHANPFLVAQAAGAVATTAVTGRIGGGRSAQKLRRQTISDPYAHIRYITGQHALLQYDARSHAGSNSNHNHNNNNTDYQANNHSAKSAYAFQAAAASTTLRQPEWQISLQQQQQQQQPWQSPCAAAISRGSGGQQQVLMPSRRELPLHLQPPQASCDAAAADDDCRPFGIYVKATTRPAEDHLRQQQQQQQQVAADYALRPVKLPLRKYHSFHFQPSQTVAGIGNCQLQQLRQQMQRQQQLLQQQQQQQLEDDSSGSFMEPQRYVGEGPLVFCPLRLDEQHAFKPISPDVATSTATSTATTTKTLQGTATAAVGQQLDSGDFTQLGKCVTRGGGGGIAHRIHSHMDRGSVVHAIDCQDDEGITDACNAVPVVATQQHQQQHIEDDDDDRKSEMSEELAEEVKKITKAHCARRMPTAAATSPLPPGSLGNLALNPAASLEALEALTKSNPELIYATKPGTRHNLHTQLALSYPGHGGDDSGANCFALMKCNTSRAQTSLTTTTTAMPMEVSTTATTKASNREYALDAPTVMWHVGRALPGDDCEEEDPGYSYCEVEDEAEDDGVGKTPHGSNPIASPGVTVILSGNSSRQRNVEGQVRYVMAKRYREVHI